MLTPEGPAHGLTRAEMQRLIDRLAIPVPWDREVFTRVVEEERGRPITLIPVDNSVMADSACGLWLVRDHDDIVLFADGTSEYHADQIILHEFGHMILGHDKAADLVAPMISSLTTHLDASTVRAALGRTAYDNAAEHDAELFASLILSRRRGNTSSTIRNAFLGDR